MPSRACAPWCVPTPRSNRGSPRQVSPNPHSNPIHFLIPNPIPIPIPIPNPSPIPIPSPNPNPNPNPYPNPNPNLTLTLTLTAAAVASAAAALATSVGGASNTLKLMLFTISANEADPATIQTPVG